MHSFPEIEALAQRTLAAADLLCENGFYNQAAARAYYAIFVLVNYSANHTPGFIWPKWTNPGLGNGSNQGHLPHRYVHDHAQTIYDFAGRPGLTLSKAPSPRHAIKELSQQRITCDYISANEMGHKLAKRLIFNARELVRVFIRIANDSQGNKVHVVK